MNAWLPEPLSRVTRGCSPWETCLRSWVRNARKLHISLGFSRANRGATDTARDAVLYENASLSPDEPIPRDTNSYKDKDKLFPGSSVDVSESVCVTALGPKGPISVSGLGILNPIPFRSAARQTEHGLRFGRRLASERNFPIP
ncbi:hypothetical protein JTE90_022071 [Oedothorax gibbosus]|uniref:Uncharacterized protein n=1 Tax=Oedothorax gibbosus TaxID=931172 RepID=A0AAV6TIY6_9ARAC|nr:hypothetical protein JTE90_022071 [Oedothorax gibbosus]